jgi:IS30 family transposase
MKKYTHLSLKEREEICTMKQDGLSLNHIGRIMDRDKSTIFRELRRNKYINSIAYTPDRAHKMAKDRKYILVPKLEQNKILKNYLIEKLYEKWSPDVIAAK